MQPLKIAWVTKKIQSEIKAKYSIVFETFRLICKHKNQINKGKSASCRIVKISRKPMELFKFMIQRTIKLMRKKKPAIW